MEDVVFLFFGTLYIELNPPVHAPGSGTPVYTQRTHKNLCFVTVSSCKVEENKICLRFLFSTTIVNH